MNFGAVFLTNMMVMKQNAIEVEAGIAEPKVFKEVNPVQAELNNYEPHPESKELINALLKQVALWFVMIFFYVYFRRTVFTEDVLNLMIIFVSFYFLVLGWDFFNDYGFFTGKVVFQ